MRGSKQRWALDDYGGQIDIDELPQKFYLEYRTAVGYAKEDPAALWPTFGSLEEWMPAKSTKMDVCGRICAHYLTHDDVEDVKFEDGKPVFPLVPAIPEDKLKRTRRIIIYAEFPSMAPLLQNVCTYCSTWLH